MSLINSFTECISILCFHIFFSDYTVCDNFNSVYFLQDATELLFFQSHSVQLQFLQHSTVAFVATVSHLWWRIFLCRKYFPEFSTYSIFVNFAACIFTLLVHLHTCNLPSKFMEYLVNNLVMYLNSQSLHGKTWQNKMKVSYLYIPVKYILLYLILHKRIF